ncbi:arabinose efflux permease family protein [Actinobacteria bacterium IMCC26256]|nr:arabinose efflux permease family protein [Actinobacteria bacterium IMCC26256]
MAENNATSETPERGRFARLMIDTRPLRRREFRLLWLGELVSETGSNIAVVALYVQVYRITGSALAVGGIGLVQFVPILLSALFGAPLVDRHDRRSILLIAHWCEAGAALLLLVGVWIGSPPLLLVYLAAALVAGSGSLALAARSAMTPNLVPHDELPAALALNQAMWNTCLIVGPALGGLLIARFGLGIAYGLDLVTFAAALISVRLMRPHPPVSASSTTAPSREGALMEGPAESEAESFIEDEEGWARVTAGFRYLKGRRVLQATFIVDLIAMVFGMPRALFPVLAQVQFHAGPELVGLLFSAVAVGALIGALTSGWVHRINRQGRAVLIAVALWGAGIVAFGLSGSSIGLALGCLAVAGGADVISAVFRNTILQRSVPDDLRGRLSGIHILVVTGGPRLGDMEAGLVATLASPTVSVVSGGVICILAVGALAILVPAFTNYRAPE